MVMRILTHFAVAKKWGKKEGIVYRSPRIYLPTKLTDDSSFPFLEGDQVSVRVEGERLIVERLKVPRGGRGKGRKPVGGSHGVRRRRRGRLRRQGLKHVDRRTRR